MHMKVKHRLPGRFTGIEADVVALRLMSPFDLPAGQRDGSGERLLLSRRSVEPRRNVPSGDQQSVPRRNGESVPEAEHVF